MQCWTPKTSSENGNNLWWMMEPQTINIEKIKFYSREK